jgi:hypothetical protein
VVPQHRSAFFFSRKGLQMPTSDADLDAIRAAGVKNAQRAVKSLTIGDRRIDYTDPKDALAAKRALDNDNSDGLYTMIPAQKGYF